MALSGSFGNTFRTGYRLQVDWTATQNTANNTSTITANLYLVSLGSAYTIYSSATKSGYVKIATSTSNFSGAGLASLSGNQKKLLHTYSYTVTHNSDGTLTTSVIGSFGLNVTLGGTYYGNISTTANITLNTILRASIPTLNYSTRDMGQVIRISTNRATTSFTHKVYYSFGNLSRQLITTGVGDYYDWTIPLATLAPQIPNATSGTLTIHCATYNSDTLIGEKTVTFTATVPTSVVPTISDVTHSETASLIGYGGTAIGVYLQNLSRIRFEVTGATGVYSSTIASYSISIDGTQYSGQTVTSGAINKSGNITIIGKVYDSRGRTATKTITVNLLSYTNPYITSFTVMRCNSDGTLNAMGTYAKVTSVGGISSVVNSTQRNQLTYKLYSRARGTSDWGTAVKNTTLTLGTLTLNASDVIGEGGYTATNSYDFRLDVVDKFNTTLSLVALSTGEVTMSWNKNGVGVGKVWQQGALDVGGDVYISGTLKVGGTDVSLDGHTHSYLPLSGGEVSGPVAVTTMTASEGYNKLGRTPAFTWSGTITSGNYVTITHNLGYEPIVKLSGNMGNIILTTNDIDANNLKVYCYSSGGNSWTGKVSLY